MFWPACKLEKQAAVKRVEERGAVGGRASVRGRPCVEGAVTGSANELLSPGEAISFV